MPAKPIRTNRGSAANGKPGLHPRNLHKQRYDFPALIDSCAELAPFVKTNAHGNLSVDFADPEAVKVLNRALLFHFYGLRHWDLPDGYLCPPIPGRADYIHHLADLLAQDNGGEVPQGRQILGLDIGTGANAIYPIIGHRSYGWRFIASDIDPVSIATAELIGQMNPVLKKALDCRLQNNADDCFNGVLKSGEMIDFSLCNPPFHSSMAQASAGTQRKLKNLGNVKGGDKTKLTLNFGGQNAELWCPGGEQAFVKRMVQQSRAYAEQCCWFTSLVSKKENLPAIYAALKKVKAVDVRTVKMAQGKKVSRFVAWSFLDAETRSRWANSRWRA